MAIQGLQSFSRTAAAFADYSKQLLDTGRPITSSEAKSIQHHFKVPMAEVERLRSELLARSAVATDQVAHQAKSQVESGQGGAMYQGAPKISGIGARGMQHGMGSADRLATNYIEPGQVPDRGIASLVDRDNDGRMDGVTFDKQAIQSLVNAMVEDMTWNQGVQRHDSSYWDWRGSNERNPYLDPRLVLDIYNKSLKD